MRSQYYEFKTAQITINDLRTIVSVLIQDEFGKNKEHLSKELDQRCINAFHKINNDPNQYLMLICEEERVLGTCHLTLLPSLTFIGSMRMQIEAVRVH